ncbi:hypothetical protein [Micromonospora rhizosphaerae]|uniref:hypothetical protein n=1 Tax=Micromonospora rhizosphaerae TaxID=568872 RepID=UPI001C405F76|nr:hypothetical protein [Micromonospora rhizosphaerae]
MRPDAVLRQTSGEAAYWHGYARRLPPPPTPEQRAEAERRAQLERERRQEEYRLRKEARRWGGRPPGERLRGLDGRGAVTLMARLDRDLVDDVVAADPGTQRRIARWAARRAHVMAGIADLDWMAPAWAALERGDALPEPFTNPAAMWRRVTGHDLTAETRVVARLVEVPLGPTTDLSYLGGTPLSAAVKALTDAALPDPLEAALGAVWTTATAYGAEAAVFLADVRRPFPDVAREQR